MAISHNDHKKKLSPERRARIAARAKELIAEEMTLQELRKARQLSQETVAELLNMRQGDVSKLEHRTDAYISTLRRYVQALGGTLDLLVTFPDTKPVKIMRIGDLDDDSAENREPEMV
jgi:transcriptional regulator with XRE-family HTH domain